MSEYPVADPETGEVLAMDASEAAEVARLLGGQLVTAEAQAEAARKQASECRRKLAALLGVGEAVPLGGGWAVTVKPGAPPRRQVNKQALLEHLEALPEHLRPYEPATPALTFPGVSQLTTSEARAALAREGLSPEQFLLAGDPGPPSVVLVPPQAEPEPTA